jgi:Domain of unknown function (DUF4477)
VKSLENRLNASSKLHASYELLQKMIHLDHYPLRKMRGFANLNRTKQALKRHIELNLQEVLLEFNGILPDVPGNKQEIRMPCRETLDFVLLRLQGAGKLSSHAVKCAKSAATFFLQFLAIGHYVERNLLYVALLADIWHQSREVCKAVVRTYNELLTFRRGFKEGGEFLPAGYTLPSNLADFIGPVWHSDVELDVSKSSRLQASTAVFKIFADKAPEASFGTAVTASLKQLKVPSAVDELSIEEIFQTVLDRREFEEEVECASDALEDEEGEPVDREDFTRNSIATACSSNKRLKK